MRLYLSEIYKIKAKKVLWAAIIGGALLNIILCVWSSRKEIISANDYKRIYSEINSQEFNYDEIRKYMLNKQEGIDPLDYWGQQLYSQLLYQLDNISNYDDFLSEIDNRAEKILSISIFGKRDSFVYRSILKTPPAYEHLKGKQLKFSNSQAVLFATSREFTDIFALVLIFLVATTLILSEKEHGYFFFTRPTKKGRIPLLIAKLSAIFTFSIFTFIILYAGNFLSAYILYGGVDCSNWIQSIEGFLGTVLDVTIGGYFVIYAITKILAYILIASFFSFICIIARTGLFVYVIASLSSIASVLLYTLIPANSHMALLKYFNTVSILNANKIYENYFNINIGGYPVNVLCLSAFMVFFSTFLFIIIGILVFGKQKNIIFHDSRPLQWIADRLFKRRRVSSCLLSYEGYKIFIVNKPLIILIIVMIIGWYEDRTFHRVYIQNDSIYKYYITQVEGEIGEETYQILDKEQSYYAELRMDMDVIRKEFQSGNMDIIVYNSLLGSIQNKLKREVGLSMVLDKVKEIEPYYTQKGDVKPWLLYDTGYKQLLGVSDNINIKVSDLVFLMGLIACIAPIYARENTLRARWVLMSTKKGRQHSLFARIGIGIIVTLILFVAAHIPSLLNILNSYGTNGIEAPIQSITKYHDFPVSLSIAGFICFLYGVKMIFALIMMLLLICISYYSKNVTTAISISAGLFLIPYAIFMTGAFYIQNFLWLPNTLGYVYFTKVESALDMFILLSNLILVLGLSCILVRKTCLHIKNPY